MTTEVATNAEQSVRDAAAALKHAILTAMSEGYRVSWPGSADGLDTISVSDTAAVEAKRRAVAPIEHPSYPTLPPRPEAIGSAAPAAAPATFGRPQRLSPE